MYFIRILCKIWFHFVFGMCDVEAASQYGAAQNNTDVEFNNGKRNIENIVCIQMVFEIIEIASPGEC